MFVVLPTGSFPVGKSSQCSGICVHPFLRVRTRGSGSSIGKFKLSSWGLSRTSWGLQFSEKAEAAGKEIWPEDPEAESWGGEGEPGGWLFGLCRRRRGWAGQLMETSSGSSPRFSYSIQVLWVLSTERSSKWTSASPGHKREQY